MNINIINVHQFVMLLLCLAALCFSSISCLEKDVTHLCTDPGPISQGGREPVYSQNPSGFEVGSTIHFYCEEGYNLVGSPQMICSFNSIWDPLEKPLCEKVVCLKPLIVNAHWSPQLEEFEYGTHLIIHCGSGYRLADAIVNQIKCEKDGEWHTVHSSYMPYCVEITCPNPDTLSNGIYTAVKGQQTSHGWTQHSVLVYSCQPGYILKDHATDRIFCTPDGIWSSYSEKLRVCVKAVCARPKLLNGDVNVLEGTEDMDIYPIGFKMNFQCHNGYILNGEALQECSENLTWEPQPTPSCIPNPHCPPPTKVQNGDFLPHSDLYEVGSEIQFYCDAGYRLDGVRNHRCLSNGEWSETPPTCILDDGDYRDSLHINMSSKVLTIAVVACIPLLVLLLVILIIVLHRRNCLMPKVCRSEQPEPEPVEDPDRVALIACSEGGGQVVLPTYEEAVSQPGRHPVRGRLRLLSSLPATSLPHHVPLEQTLHMGIQRDPSTADSSSIGSRSTVSSRRARASLAANSIHSSSLGGSLGSTETMAASEVSTTITLDTVDSNSSNFSTAASVKALCGSIASGESTDSIVNTEGSPLLNENETLTEEKEPDVDNTQS